MYMKMKSPKQNKVAKEVFIFHKNVEHKIEHLCLFILIKSLFVASLLAWFIQTSRGQRSLSSSNVHALKGSHCLDTVSP